MTVNDVSAKKIQTLTICLQISGMLTQVKALVLGAQSKQEGLYYLPVFHPRQQRTILLCPSRYPPYHSSEPFTAAVSSTKIELKCTARSRKSVSKQIKAGDPPAVGAGLDSCETRIVQQCVAADEASGPDVSTACSGPLAGGGHRALRPGPGRRGPGRH